MSLSTKVFLVVGKSSTKFQVSFLLELKSINVINLEISNTLILEKKCSFFVMIFLKEFASDFNLSGP